MDWAHTGIPLTGVLETGIFGIVEMCLGLMRKLRLGITKPGCSHPGQTFSGHAKTPVSKTLLREPQIEGIRAKGVLEFRARNCREYVLPFVCLYCFVSACFNHGKRTFRSTNQLPHACLSRLVRTFLGERKHETSDVETNNCWLCWLENLWNFEMPRFVLR